MLSEPLISLKNLGKCYQIYDQPRDRLLQMFYRSRKRLFREFWALQGINLDIYPGEVVGIVGRNGSGKSTLLQMVCGTLTPSVGEVIVKGRIAALLELGAGFNPEYTGRENVYLSAMISGMTQAEVAEKFETIVEFSGIRHFIDQPVKTYSSGMYVRLAFSIAIHVDPDILVVDEALSVGDGEFSHKSFKRIMELKDAGKTILFCSHSLYQVEALCSRALWMEQGVVRQLGEASVVTTAYGQHLNALAATPSVIQWTNTSSNSSAPVQHTESDGSPSGSFVAASLARLIRVELRVNGRDPEKKAVVNSLQDDVQVQVAFVADTQLPEPVVGIGISDEHDRMITSVSSHIDNVRNLISSTGEGFVEVTFPAFPLLKGNYLLHVYLLCERGIHVYDSALAVAHICVHQAHLEQGSFSIPRRWHCPSRSVDLTTG